jgi:hypothetical protein
MNQAIRLVTNEKGLEISEFCIYPDKNNLRHHWFLGVEGDCDQAEIMSMIDKKLCELNDDYAGVRKYTLKDPIVKVLKPEDFYGFMRSIGKAGSQNKFPRVMNDFQSEKWLNYLKDQQLV